MNISLDAEKIVNIIQNIKEKIGYFEDNTSNEEIDNLII